MFEENKGIDITNISIYITIIIIVLISIWYFQSYILVNKEDYAPNRERSDPQSDWSIVNAIRRIREKQSKYFSKFTQSPNYGV